MRVDIADFAWQVIEMDREIKALRAENAALLKTKADYDSLLDSSLQHGQRMMGNTLKMLLTPGVSEAFITHSESLANDQ
jgi:hypothetical protein